METWRVQFSAGTTQCSFLDRGCQIKNSFRSRNLVHDTAKRPSSGQPLRSIQLMFCLKGDLAHIDRYCQERNSTSVRSIAVDAKYPCLFLVDEYDGPIHFTWRFAKPCSWFRVARYAEPRLKYVVKKNDFSETLRIVAFRKTCRILASVIPVCCRDSFQLESGSHKCMLRTRKIARQLIGMYRMHPSHILLAMRDSNFCFTVLCR